MVIPAHGSGELRHARQSWNQRGFICGSIEPTNRLRSWLCSTLTSLVWGTAHSSRCCPASPLPLGEKSSGAQFHAHLLQLCVFRLGLLQDGDVGVGVFPECKEVLIRGTGLRGVALQHISANEAKMGKRTDGLVQDEAAMIENLLELGGSLATLMRSQIGSPRTKTGNIAVHFKSTALAPPSSYGTATARLAMAAEAYPLLSASRPRTVGYVQTRKPSMWVLEGTFPGGPAEITASTRTIRVVHKNSASPTGPTGRSLRKQKLFFATC